jgi:hypothetical protein
VSRHRYGSVGLAALVAGCLVALLILLPGRPCLDCQILPRGSSIPALHASQVHP